MHTLPRSLFLAAILVTIFSVSLSAQTGGRGTYDFLNFPYSARVTGLGGDFVAIKDNDISSAYSNPSLITPLMKNTLGIGLATLSGAYKYGYASYGMDFKKVGSFVGTIQFINYGKFTAANESGDITGEFTGGEYAFNVGWGRSLGKLFSIGANGKFIYSSLENYKSLGLAVDVAATYSAEKDLFSASLIAKNIGRQITTYYDGHVEPLPFELQAGMSTRLQHIPVRISVLYNHLERWDLSYLDPQSSENQKDPITGEIRKKSDLSKFGDNFMRHIVLGSEITIAKVLAVRIGYNYQHRQELKLPQRHSLSGFSYGLGLHVKMFSLNYARTIYTPGGLNPNYFTLTINFGEFVKREAPATEE